MAKKRRREAVNPLKMDAVAALAQPPAKATSTAVLEPPTEGSREPSEPAARDGLPALQSESKEVSERPKRSAQVELRSPPARERWGAEPAPERRAPKVQRDPRASLRGAARPKDEVQVKTRMKPEEADELEALRRQIELQLGVKIRGSQIGRALYKILLRAQDDLDAVRPPELMRPSYGASLDMADFEDALTDYLHAVIKRAKRTG